MEGENLNHLKMEEGEGKLITLKNDKADNTTAADRGQARRRAVKKT
jgi:hypothetical protein